jgi:Holliday junction resolvase RusA-like endonuclease
MTQPIEIWVPGKPEPGGSKKGFAIPRKDDPKKFRAIVTEDNRKSKPWREAVAWAAVEAFRMGQPFDGPLDVEFRFYVPRPKGHFGKNGIRPAMRFKQPVTKPDVTKLIRSTEDALKGIAWGDDSQIVSQAGRKFYSGRPGALITIRPAEVDIEQPNRDEELIKQLGLRALGLGA